VGRKKYATLKSSEKRENYRPSEVKKEEPALGEKSIHRGGREKENKTN